MEVLFLSSSIYFRILKRILFFYKPKYYFLLLNVFVKMRFLNLHYLHYTTAFGLSMFKLKNISLKFHPNNSSAKPAKTEGQC